MWCIWGREILNAYWVLVEGPEGERPLGSPGMDLTEIR
jgi:hypothetical protein